MQTIYQAGQVPAGTGNAKEDAENLRRYLAGLTEQIETILMDIQTRLEAMEHGISAGAAKQQQSTTGDAD